MDFENISISKSKKKNKKKRVEEPVVEDTVTKRKINKKAKAMPSPSISNTSKAGDVKFGRKKIKNEMNNNVSPMKDLDQSFSSIDSSEAPKIKKRKSTLDASIRTEGNYSTDEDLSMLSVFQTPAKKQKVDKGMNTEENKKLLQLAVEQVNHEMVPILKRWSTLDFKKIAKNFDNKTPEDCEIQLKMLIEIVPQKKCLHQILSEALDELPKEKAPINNFANFIHLEADQINEELNKGKLGQTRLTVASAMWKALSKEEKRSFEPKKVKVCKLDGQSSFEVFYMHLKKKNPDVSNKEARGKWTEMKLTKKIKYIKKSAKIMSSFLEVKDEDSKKIKGPTKDEVALYLDHAEAPKEPPKLVSVFYFLKVSDPNQAKNNLLMDSIKAFNTLSKSKQEEWTKKHQKAVKQYESSLEQWQLNQDEITLFIYKLSRDSKADKKKEKLPKSPTGKILKLNTIEMPVGNVKFKSEPVIPPLNPVTLYAKEHEKTTGEKISPKESRELFSALDKNTKLSFKKNVENIKDRFKNGLLDYVGSLTIDQKKLFLGLKRVKFMRLLGEDVFESEYPNEEYPVYSKPEKGKEKDKEIDVTADYYNLEEKQANEDAYLDDKEVEDEEEEEEESDESSNPSPVKSNKARDYSARKGTNSMSYKKINKKAVAQEEETESEEESDTY